MSKIDAFQAFAQSRLKEQESMFRMRLQLVRMTRESQQRIQEMRAKGNLARLKLVQKALDS